MAKAPQAAAPRDELDSAAHVARLRSMFDDHYAFIWRQLRRLGLSEDATEDAAQQVFIVASRKLDGIIQGSERSFLMGTALRVASDARRATSRRHEVADEESAEPADPAPRADELLDRQRARAMLDKALAAMPFELRTVFVLFELEELTMAEIAELLGLAPGTVASRLRRARQDYSAAVKKLRLRATRQGAA